jgi:DNA repair photolyase
LLSEPGRIVRILAKNTAVARDFDLIKKHRDRVLVGLSLTGTSEKNDVLAIVEPNASLVSERMQTSREANERGLRTFGMLCPLLPGVAETPAQIEELVAFLEGCRRRGIRRGGQPAGPGLKCTEDALRESGLVAEADAMARIRRVENWPAYVTNAMLSMASPHRPGGKESRSTLRIHQESQELPVAVTIPIAK